MDVVGGRGGVWSEGVQSSAVGACLDLKTRTQGGFASQTERCWALTKMASPVLSTPQTLDFGLFFLVVVLARSSTVQDWRWLTARAWIRGLGFED